MRTITRIPRVRCATTAAFCRTQSSRDRRRRLRRHRVLHRKYSPPPLKSLAGKWSFVLLRRVYTYSYVRTMYAKTVFELCFSVGFIVAVIITSLTRKQTAFKNAVRQRRKGSSAFVTRYAYYNAVATTRAPAEICTRLCLHNIIRIRARCKEGFLYWFKRVSWAR